MPSSWRPGSTRQTRSKRKKLDFERELKFAYGLVEQRESFRCLVTGLKLVRSTEDPWRLLTHHHIEARSLAKLRRTEPANIVLLSLAVHKLVTAGLLYLLTETFEKAERFDQIAVVAWNRARVKVGEEPIRVLPQLLREVPIGATTFRGLTAE